MTPALRRDQLARGKTMNAMERINRETWRADSSLRLYGSLEGFFDPGEEAAFAAFAADAHGGRVLDLGVGGGRTAGLLGPIARDYVGIDYTPEMVALSRSRFPDLTFEEADARDLSRFADGSFDCVVFSCNAIDSVDEDGRAKILAECARVLDDDGALYFSTFNRDGPGFRDRRNNRRIERTLNPVRLGYSAAKFFVGGMIGWTRIARWRAFERDDGDHAILLHKAHDFGILVHAASVAAIRKEVAAAGFKGAPKLFGVSGAAISGDDADDEEYVHVIVRKA
jgi:SAM-dependent methyltransferase